MVEGRMKRHIDEQKDPVYLTGVKTGLRLSHLISSNERYIYTNYIDERIKELQKDSKVEHLTNDD